jgi:hypothetical protein
MKMLIFSLPKGSFLKFWKGWHIIDLVRELPADRKEYGSTCDQLIGEKNGVNALGNSNKQGGNKKILQWRWG